MTPVRLEPAALRSRVKHSTTEPLRSLYVVVDSLFIVAPNVCSFLYLVLVLLCSAVLFLVFQSSRLGREKWLLKNAFNVM